jgi:RNA polymerase sigma-70 factor, ECF subfamily
MSAERAYGESDTSPSTGFEHDALALSESLFRHAMRLTRKHADAEDLVQETFMHAFAGSDKFRPGTNLRAWMYRIMHNVWISNHRRTMCRPTEYLEGIVTDQLLGAHSAQSRQESAEDHVLARLPDSDLRDALASLPDSFRIPLYYATVEGYTYQEVAQMMNIPVGTVMSRVHRSRRRLRNDLLTVGNR